MSLQRSIAFWYASRSRLLLRLAEMIRRFSALFFGFQANTIVYALVYTNSKNPLLRSPESLVAVRAEPWWLGTEGERVAAEPSGLDGRGAKRAEWVSREAAEGNAGETCEGVAGQEIVDLGTALVQANEDLGVIPDAWTPSARWKRKADIFVTPPTGNRRKGGSGTRFVVGEWEEGQPPSDSLSTRKVASGSSQKDWRASVYDRPRRPAQRRCPRPPGPGSRPGSAAGRSYQRSTEGPCLLSSGQRPCVSGEGGLE